MGSIEAALIGLARYITDHFGDLNWFPLYLAALDDPTLPPADFRWRGTSAATITADLRPEQLLSVQVAFDEGWHARVQGQPRPVRSDRLGQMAIEPHCSGPCVVELTWDGGAGTLVARGTALAGGLLWIVLWRKRSDWSVVSCR